MACKTWVRFLFLLKPHTSKRWGRGGGEGKPRRYQQNDVNKGHDFCPLLLLTSQGTGVFSLKTTITSERQFSKERCQTLQRFRSWASLRLDWSSGTNPVCAVWMLVRPRSKGRTCGCTQGSTSASKGGEYSKAVVILVWKYHKKPLLFGFFSFTIFLFQFRFNTPAYDSYFYT